MKYFQPLRKNEGFLTFKIRIKENPKLVLENLRKRHPQLVIQFARLSAVRGESHLIWAIRQNWTAGKRRILAANRQEIDLLMRLAQTDQVSAAIDLAGVSSGHRSAIAVAIGTKLYLERFESWIIERLDTSSYSHPPHLVEKEKSPLIFLEKSAVLLARTHRVPRDG